MSDVEPLGGQTLSASPCTASQGRVIIEACSRHVLAGERKSVQQPQARGARNQRVAHVRALFLLHLRERGGVDP